MRTPLLLDWTTNEYVAIPTAFSLNRSFGRRVLNHLKRSSPARRAGEAAATSGRGTRARFERSRADRDTVVCVLADGSGTSRSFRQPTDGSATGGNQASPASHLSRLERK